MGNHLFNFCINIIILKNLKNILKLNNESNTYSLIGQLFYHYDLNNELVSVENEGNIYFYVKDLLGVIHKIVDVNGNTVIQYIYDGWGKLINSYTGSVNAFVAQYNPFIYKSYYYDPRYSYDNTVRASSIAYGNNIGAYYGYDYLGSIFLLK